MGCNKELNSRSFRKKNEEKQRLGGLSETRYTLVIGVAGGAVSRVATIYNGSVRSRKSSRAADYTRPAGD